MRFLKIMTAAAAAVLTIGTAHADVIPLTSGDVGSSFTVNYNGFTGGGVVDGLAGSILFTLTGVSGSSYSFDYAVSNTSSNPILTSRISGFGFNTNPDIVGASSTGVFDTVGTDANVPNIGTVDVCFKGGGGTNSCAGGGGGGVALGDDASGTLDLDFGSVLGGISLSDFFVRYQSITGAGAGTPSSAVGKGTISSSGGTPVPEPADFALFAVGVAGLLLGRQGVRARTRRAA